MVRKTALAIAACLAFIATPAPAKYVQTAKVRYETREGQSQWQTMDVQFLMGAELNLATSSLRYNGMKPYAVIFFGQGQAAVIEIDGYIFCSLEFDRGCLPLNGNMQGKDQDGTVWKICTSDYC